MREVVQPVSMAAFAPNPAQDRALMAGEVGVQLSLGTAQLGEAAEGDPLAVVRAGPGWGSQVLASLAVLEMAGMASVRITLEAQQDPAAAGRDRGGGGGGGGAAASPTHARIQVSLVSDAVAGVFWQDEESGDLGDQVEAPGRSTGQPRGTQATLKGWRRHGDAAAAVVVALLEHGEGLAIGPDCDGVLNFGDTPEGERSAALAAPPAALRAQFDVEAVLEAVAPAAAPAPSAAPAPAGLRSSPKHYQLTGLQWMLDRERRGDALRRGHAHLHPAWLQLATPGGELLSLHRLRPHLLSTHFFTAPPVGTCGGCIADEMGLGKSLQTLMLALAHRPPRGWAVTSIEGLLQAGGRGAEGFEPVPVKTTLLVAPATLLSQWQDEIERHLAPRALSWGRFAPPEAGAAGAADALAPEGAESGDEGPRRSRRARTTAGANSSRVDLGAGPQAVRAVACAVPGGGTAPLHSLDLVLISYEHLRDQLHMAGSQLSVLQQYGFWRVCLDEAQLIANSSSVAAVMASSLWRRHAW
jgi:E3 ubiquitin-protein ligase SHPRH